MRDRRLQPPAQHLEPLRAVVGSGELQVDELQRGLQVGGRARARDPVRVLLHLRRDLHELARQQLLEVAGREAAHAHLAHRDGGQQRLQHRARLGQRGAAQRVGPEEDLVVLEVGGLEPRLDAVRQRQHGDPEGLERAPRDHAAAGGRMLEELAAGGAVLPRRDGGLRDRGQRGAQVGLGGDGHARLVRRHRQHHPAVLVQQAAGHVAHLVERDGGQELPHQRQLHVDAGARLAGEEVRDVLARVGAALALVPLLPGARVLREQLARGPVQLGGGEAVLAHALGFGQHRAQAGGDAAVGHDRAEDLRLHRPPQRPGRRGGAQEGRVGAPRHLGQPRVEHGVEQRLHQAAPIVDDRLLVELGVLVDHGHAGDARLGVGGHAHEGLGMRGDGGLRARGSGRRRGQVAQRSADPLLGLRGIDIAHHRHRHAVRPVPLSRERAQARGIELPDHVGKADGKPLGVARSVQEHGKLDALQARVRALAEPPFLEHDAALLVDLLLAERPSAGEIRERGEALLHQAAPIGGHLQHVHRLVECGVRVGVGAEARADGFEVGHQLAGREVPAPVEGHVLEHVRQPPLVLLLEDGPRVDGQAQGHAVLRPLVAPDVVGHPARQRPAADDGVEGERILEPVRGGARLGRGCRCGGNRAWAGPRRVEGGGKGREREGPQGEES